ncbi:unnamed protein product [Brassica rapa subsp. trilocularis]
MADIMKQILAKPIQLSDQAKTEKLAGLLRQVSRASSDLYERPSSSSVEPRHHEARLHHHLLRRFRKMSPLPLGITVTLVTLVFLLSPPMSPSSASSGSILLFSTPDPLKTAQMLPLPSFLLPAIAIATLSLSSRKEA